MRVHRLSSTQFFKMTDKMASFQSWMPNVVLASAVFWLALYLYFIRDFSYWKKRHINFLKPIPFFGNALDIFVLKKSIGDLCWDIYNQTADPFTGFFVCAEPCLLVRDTSLIKTILVKDFGVFNNRTMTDNIKDDPLGSHILFVMKTPDWRGIRRKITPVFTTGKTKKMYELIREAGQDLVEYLDKEIATNPIVETREVSAKYTTDAITSTAFGIKAGCFQQENAEFRVVSRRIFNWHILERGISTTCYFVAPALVKLFKLKFIDSFSSGFLRDVFWKTIQEREDSKVSRNDLLDIIIEMKKSEKIDDPYKLEGDKLVAQAAQFFVAGYETTSSTISFTLYELAKNPEVQDKLRKEISAITAKYGEFSYDAVKEMEYLDMCIKETLRKYPVVPFLDRRSNADYKIPGTEAVLRKGTSVFISTLGLQYDPQYFPDPEKYDPERFTPENFEQIRQQFVYLPFGEGPRNCIGARFGTLSSKSGVAHIISKFNVTMCSKTQNPMKFDPRGFLLAPIGGLRLEFSKI